MTEPDAGRLYSEQEISALFRQAAELQKAGTHTSAPGLSLAEIERIAAEVGLDPQYIRAAALTTLQPEAEEKRIYALGAPTHVEATRTLPGTLTETQWEAMMQEVRRAFGYTGRTEQRGHTREWMTTSHQLEEVRLTAHTVNEQTTIQLSQQYDGIAFLMYLAGGMAGLIGVSALVAAVEGSLLLDLALAGGGAGTVFGLLRTAFGHLIRKQRRVQKALLDKFSTMLSTQPTAKPSSLPEGASMDPRLSLPDPATYDAEQKPQQTTARERL